jgi:hypothetical protein
VGEPLSVEDELKEYRIPEPFRLFSRESQKKYRDRFEAVTRILMDRINGLVDEEYRR